MKYPHVVQIPKLLTSKKLFDICSAFFTRVLRQATLLLITAVAARMLSKNELGVWAILYTFVQFGFLLCESGTTSYLVREARLSSAKRSAALLLTTFLAITIVLCEISIVLGCGGWLSIEEYYLEAFFACLLVLPLCIAGYCQALLRREKRFTSLFWAEMIGSGVQLVTALSCFLNESGVYVFVFSIWIGTVAQLVYFRTLVVWKLSPTSLVIVREIWSYSSGILGFSTIHFWARNSDVLLIARYLGSTPLAYYSLANRIMLLPLSQINAAVHVVALPYLSRIQDDHVRLQRSVLGIVMCVSLVATPLTAAIWVFREFIVEVFFGEGWATTADLLYILVPIGLLQSLLNPLGLCYQVVGRTDVYFWIGLFNTSVYIAAFWIGALQGELEAIAICYAIANLLLCAPTAHIGMRLIGGNFFNWFGRAWTGLAFFALLFFGDRLGVSFSPVVEAFVLLCMWFFQLSLHRQHLSDLWDSSR